jgi:probable HAF family extracellular repeat protein
MTQDLEARMREMLSSVDMPASRLSAVDLARSGAQVRRRRRQLVTAGMAGVATLGLGTAIGVASGSPAPAPEVTQPVGASATPAPVACVAQRLPLPEGATAGEVTTGSPSGRYLAGLVTGKDDPGKPARWSGARVEQIPIDGTGEAEGVNERGIVVGEGQTAGRRHYAWAYADGKVVELPVPDGYTGAEAQAINARGQVAGVLFAGDRAAAVVWQTPTATAQVKVLESPGGAMAFGISDDGVVVGGLHDGSSAYRWDAQGRGGKLTSPAGTVGGSAYGVRGEWAYGLLTRAGKPPTGDPTAGTPQTVDWNTAVVWNLRSGRATPVGDGRVQAVNLGGQTMVDHPDGRASVREVDGTLRALPGPAHGAALSDDGFLAAGSSADRPVSWLCGPGKGNR